tara:strand:+ start:172 stop:972 length:801 start_codon:yes stop_codon:yes gene_type:complete
MLFFASLALGLAVPAQNKDELAPAPQQTQQQDAWGDKWVHDTKQMERNNAAAAKAQAHADGALSVLADAKKEAAQATKSKDTLAAGIYNTAISEAQTYVTAAQTAAKKAVAEALKWDEKTVDTVMSGLISEAKEAAYSAKDLLSKCAGNVKNAAALQEKQFKQEIVAAEKGRGLRNGDQKYLTGEEHCMVKLANCRDKGSSYELQVQCHVAYQSCLVTAEKKAAKDKEAEAEKVAQQAKSAKAAEEKEKREAKEAKEAEEAKAASP